ncbi:hypothetical protein JCM10207_001926 [Rhodosporidiobolus poonsookiae]
MSDSEDVKSPESSKTGKDKVQNEACTNCRAVKRRCLNNGDHTPCTRCAKQSLDCTYHQNKRGRKVGSTPTVPKKRKSVPKSAEDDDEPEEVRPKAKTKRTAAAAGNGVDWLADLLRSQQAEGATTSASSAMPVPPPHAAYPVSLPTSSSFLAQPIATSTPYTNPLLAASLSNGHPPSAAARSSAFASIHPPPQPSGPSPSSAGYTSPNSAGASSSPGASALHAPPATGGFSLVKILKENAGASEGGGEGKPTRHSLADAFAPEEDRKTLPSKPERSYEDVVATGIFPEDQVQPLFDFYFLHLNPMTSMLDPALHTVEFVRTRSAILYTAILTVAAKVALPALYFPCLKYAKQLLGQAFEAGTCNVELVQAILTLVFWQEATDDSGARKLAFAIRCAFELNMHKRAKRPLPEDEMERRKVLNPERTWLYLTIADHRFGTQRGLPKMVDNNFRYDAVPWAIEQDVTNFCPSSAGLVPLVELGRILDIFAVVISPEDGLPSMELLKCLENEVEAWRCKWSLEQASIPLQPAQSSLVRFYAQVLQFQLLEVNLSVAIKTAPDSLDKFSFEPRSSPGIVFTQAVKAAVKVLDTMERELRFMVYSFDSMWVGAASAAIWLSHNIAAMDARHRQLALEALSRLQGACTEHSTSAQSMAAYTARLLQHLLHKIKNAENAASAAAAAAAPNALAAASGAVASTANASQAPAYITASLSAPTWSMDQAPFSAPPAAAGPSASAPQAMAGFAQSLPSAAPDLPAAMPAPWPYGQPVDQQQQAQVPSSQAFDPLGTAFLSMQPPLQGFGEELPFPAADDALWQSLFPLFATEP